MQHCQQSCRHTEIIHDESETTLLRIKDCLYWLKKVFLQRFLTPKWHSVEIRQVSKIIRAFVSSFWTWTQCDQEYVMWKLSLNAISSCSCMFSLNSNQVLVLMSNDVHIFFREFRIYNFPRRILSALLFVCPALRFITHEPRKKNTHSLKLARNNLKYRVQGTSTPLFFYQMIIFSMHLLPRVNVMLDFIYMDSIDLLGARGKRKIQNE